MESSDGVHGAAIQRDSPVSSNDLRAGAALWCVFDAAAGYLTFDEPSRSRAVTVSSAHVSSEQFVASQLEQWANHNSCGQPSPFADQLLVLEKFNVFRALLSNSFTLGFATEAHMKDDALSPFFLKPSESHWNFSLPVALRPTKLQRRVPHHPWIDLLPFPRMRDNLLLAGLTFDDMELCGDLVGMFSTPRGNGNAGLVVWGSAWSPNEWEITSEFLKRWSWTVEGCWELSESTNRWRARRGDMPLFRGGS